MNEIPWKLPVRTVSNALKVKVVLGREDVSDVCAADVKVHLLQPCALTSLFIGSLHLLLLRPTSHFYSIFFSSSPPYRVVQLFVHFYFQQFGLSLIGPNMLMRTNHLWNVFFLCVPVHLFCYRTIHSTRFSPFLEEKMTHIDRLARPHRLH